PEYTKANKRAWLIPPVTALQTAFQKAGILCPRIRSAAVFPGFRDRSRMYDSLNMHSLESSLIDIMRAEQDPLK
ncbi:cytoplasmic polyadenylation element-binding protein, partial [Pimephales promelas]